MANIKSSKKRARQSIKRRENNVAMRTRLRTYLKNVVKAIDASDKKAALAAFQLAQPIIDKAAQSGIIHRNKASRHKSRLSARIKALGGEFITKAAA